MRPKKREAAGRLQGAPDTNSTDEESAGEADNAAGSARQAQREHDLLVPQPLPQQPLFDAQQFVASFMQSFAQSQAEINRNLIETLRSTAGTPSSSTNEPAAAVAPAAATGNFSNCTARFNGESRDPEVLEAFLDAAETYRECTAVSDEHAVRGLSMLLEGDAAVWWRGVKSSVTTWRDATARLRAVYGTPRPGYKLLREIFAAEQQNERAEVFVCRLRALIIRLPYVVPEEMQIDMIYSLLDRRIRKRLPRDVIDTVDCLLNKARVAEDSISEVCKNSQTISSTVTTIANVSDSANSAQSVTDSEGVISNACDIKSKRNRIRCSYCKVYGHLVDDCRNLRQRQDNALGTSESRVDAPVTFSNRVNAPVTPSTEVNAPTNYRQSYDPHCYGCGKRGVIRSRCDTCNPSNRADFNYSDDNCIEASSSHPMTMVGIFGREGVAIIDTGATHCIASPKLYKIFVANNVEFQETQRTIRLADGSQQLRKVLIADVPISVGGRNFVANFMVLPGGETRTLLGFEFVAKAGIVLDGSRDTWNFADDPDNQFCLVRKYHLTVSDDAELMRAESSDRSLRSDECARLPHDQQHALNAFIARREAQCAPNGPATEFATQKFKVSEIQKPIASGQANVIADTLSRPVHIEYASCDLRLAVVDTPSRNKSDSARDIHENSQTRQKKYADEGRRQAPDYKVRSKPHQYDLNDAAVDCAS